MTGATWVDVEAILEHQLSDTTRRARRNERISAGVFDRLEAETHAAFDKILDLDRSYDYPVIGRQLRALGLDDFDIQRRGTKVPGVKQQPLRLGMRWIVETTNMWWSNYGQLRSDTDRQARHRHAALCLATILIIGKLLTHRDRWSPKSAPIC